MIAFEVSGQPIGKGRPRFTRTGQVYTPAKTKAYEEAIGYAARTAMRGKLPMQGPLAVYIDAEYAIPTSWPAPKRLAAKMRTVKPTCKPDADNVCKCVGDGLNGIAWKDDSQIVTLSFRKFYSGTPRLRVEIYEESAA